MRLTACVVAVLLWLWFAWYILSFVNPIWLMFFFQPEIIITFGSICVDAFGIWNLVHLRGSIFTYLHMADSCASDTVCDFGKISVLRWIYFNYTSMLIYNC